MLTIRLSRTGKHKAPQYRLVLQEKGRDPWAKAQEILGWYNPTTNPSTYELKEERIKEWISKGAQPSNTVHNLLVTAGVIKSDKKSSITISKKRSGKLEKKKVADAEAKAAKAEKAKAEAEAKKEEEAAAKIAAEEAKAAEAAQKAEDEAAAKAAEAEVKEEVAEVVEEAAVEEVADEALAEEVKEETKEDKTDEAPVEKSAE